ncbi:retrovirus-related Pol polyprotein from transposon 17.6 [Trichonephila clavipes]|nr:retrovirus-related Pol polyprotein from transposon 17.6 [Trichonephila clavipes]
MSKERVSKETGFMMREMVSKERSFKSKERVSKETGFMMNFKGNGFKGDRVHDECQSKKDSKPLNWSSEAITAFQRCKQALADAALLAHPSPSAPLALHVDASDYAIGSALHQVVDSELQPLAFFSRKLTSSEKVLQCLRP